MRIIKLLPLTLARGRIPELARKVMGVAVVAGILILSGRIVRAGAEAHFDGGGAIEQSATKTGIEVADNPDGVPGMPGNGWRTAWYLNANSGSQRSIDVEDATPLNGAGKYLSFGFGTLHSFPHRQMNIIRGYDGTAPPIKFAFDLRLDDTSAFQRDNAFFVVAYVAKFTPVPADDFSKPVFPQDNHMLWAIRSQSGSPNWWVYSGCRDAPFDHAKYVDTGFPAIVSDVYHFEVQINSGGGTWTVTINNLTAKTTYDAHPFQLAGESQPQLKGSFISFGGGNLDGPAPGLYLRFSLDSLSID